MHHMTCRLKSSSAAEALGESLRRARERRKMSRLELANRTGVHRSQISRIERGRVLFVSHNVQKLCTHLRVRPDQFLSQVTTSQDLEGRLLRLNALLGGRQRGDAAVTQLLEALEAFAEAYAT